MFKVFKNEDSHTNGKKIIISKMKIKEKWFLIDIWSVLQVIKWIFYSVLTIVMERDWLVLIILND